MKHKYIASFKASKAIALQRKLSSLVDLRSSINIEAIKIVVGLDVSYVSGLGLAVATALSFPGLELIKYVVVKGPVYIPYVPGLLAFREAPLLFKAYEVLKKTVGRDADLILVDGHGITHPRRFGIASHIGVILGIPTIGAAKRILTGEVRRVGSNEYIFINNIPSALVVNRGKKQVYLSIGHKISLETIEEIAPKLFKDNHYLPEPTYIADLISKIERKRIQRRD